MRSLLTPRGTLHLHTGDHEHDRAPDAWMLRVVKGFASCQASGLFALAATRPDVPPSPAFSYWRDFACRYLTRLLFRFPSPPENEGSNRSSRPPNPNWPSLLLSAPPNDRRRVCKFLTFFMPCGLISTPWVRQQISMSDVGLAEWLKTHAPMWRQVGRVCFHLCGNRRDAELPLCVSCHLRPEPFRRRESAV